MIQYSTAIRQPATTKGWRLGGGLCDKRANALKIAREMQSHCGRNRDYFTTVVAVPVDLLVQAQTGARWYVRLRARWQLFWWKP